jgi:hypothetical protein
MVAVSSVMVAVLLTATLTAVRGPDRGTDRDRLRIFFGSSGPHTRCGSALLRLSQDSSES